MVICTTQHYPAMGNNNTSVEGTQKTFAVGNLRMRRGEEGAMEVKNDDIFMSAIRVGVHKKARNMMSIL